MTLDEREIEDVLDRLDRLKAVVVDSSSIIYLSKSQFLDDVAGEIRMITIPQVVDETGIRGLPVIVVEPPSIEDVTETDRLLVAAAARQKKTDALRRPGNPSYLPKRGNGVLQRLQYACDVVDERRDRRRRVSSKGRKTA